MRATYAVSWHGPSGRIGAGKLELRPRGVFLEGTNGQSVQSLEVPYEDVAVVRVARGAAERVDGQPTLVLERRSGDVLRIAAVAQPGIVAELAQQIASYHLGLGQVTRVLIVVPLKPGTKEKAGQLLAGGPPFDPEALGLDRHSVYLTEHEAVFVFEGSTPNIVDELVEATPVWAAAAAWKEIVDGPPRLAEHGFSWERPVAAESVSFEPTPGQGDSEGGDIFAP